MQDSKMLEGSMQQSRISGGARGNPFSGTASNAASVADTSNLKGKITNLEVCPPSAQVTVFSLSRT